MSKIGVSVSLDVTKIDKARLKEVTKKDGSVAKYLNLTTFINPTEEDQYGNHGFIAQSQTMPIWARRLSWVTAVIS